MKAPTIADGVARIAASYGRLERLAALQCAVTLAQARLLTALARGPATISALADEQAVAQSTMTRTVTRLARQKLVQRRCGDDRRTVLVSLTAAGEARAKELAGVLGRRLGRALDEAALPGATGSESRACAETLGILAEALERCL
jgi:DNA-binding MarR family transcriptional regulator